MATIKKNQNNRKVTGYEAELVNALEAAVAVGLSSENVNKHIFIYEDLYASAYDFIEKVCLARYHKALSGRGIEVEAVANDIATELFWRKLDYIMNSRDPINCRGLINNTAKYRVYDCIDSDERAQNDVPMVDHDGDDAGKAMTEAEYSKANVHLTDVGWNLVASNTNLEEEAISREECLSVLEALKQNTNILEVVAFLGTKLVCRKASELAEDLLEYGKRNVYAYILQQTSSMLKLDRGFFADAAFEIDDAELKYNDIKKLSAEISRCSDRAKNKVRKILAKTK